MRWLLRLPITLYHLRLGWLLGERVMLLEHLGRKSGRWHTVVVEVVGHDDETDTYYAASGWDLRSDRYRNILAHPQVRLSTGRRRHLTAIAHVLDAPSASGRLVGYAHRQPIAMQELSEIMRYPHHKTDPEIRAMAEGLPIIAFKIAPWADTSPAPGAS